jgi:hypothetical protein
MISIMGELELRWIVRMSRPELIRAVLACKHAVPGDLLEDLEHASTERLQLLLLAARLILVARYLRDCNSSGSRRSLFP